MPATAGDVEMLGDTLNETQTGDSRLNSSLSIGVDCNGETLIADDGLQMNTGTIEGFVGVDRLQTLRRPGRGVQKSFESESFAELADERLSIFLGDKNNLNSKKREEDDSDYYNEEEEKEKYEIKTKLNKSPQILRRSNRLRLKAAEKDPIYSTESLIEIPAIDEISDPEIRADYGRLFENVTEQNKELLKHKPDTPTYNLDSFDPIPSLILDRYYEKHITPDLLLQKQLSDSVIYNILEYINNDNVHLINDLNDSTCDTY